MQNESHFVFEAQESSTHRGQWMARDTPFGDSEQQGNKPALSGKVLHKRIPMCQRREETKHCVRDGTMPCRGQLEHGEEASALRGDLVLKVNIPRLKEHSQHRHCCRCCLVWRAVVEDPEQRVQSPAGHDPVPHIVGWAMTQ